MILLKNIEHLLTGLFRKKNLILLLLFSNQIYTQKITVKQVNINDFDESSLSPFVKDGYLYFSSNKRRATITSVQSEDGESFFDIYRAEIKDKEKLKNKVEPLSDSVNKTFNEVSACITTDNTIYFSSNSFGEIKKKKIGKYGIYSYKLDSNKNVRPFEYNNPKFNVAHPTVSEDGKLLIFSSDNIAGEGMTDLYFCEKIEEKWSEPRNLGININTKFMETFPNLHGNSLYFSSNRKGGKGGLDLYVSNYDGKNWSPPKPLPEPLNTKYDDFGFTLNKDLKSGYFTSNRKKKIDRLYYFEYDMPVIQEYYQQELYFCYTLEETEMEETDSLKFSWDLGDGTKQKGKIADHCYSDTGTYNIVMSVIDKYTGTVFDNVSSYEIKIDAKNKPVIDIEDIKPGVVRIFVNNKWTNKNYTEHYWIVEGDYKFDKELTLKFKNKSEINVRLVAWNKEEESTIGIERTVYK